VAHEAPEKVRTRYDSGAGVVDEAVDEDASVVAADVVEVGVVEVNVVVAVVVKVVVAVVVAFGFIVDVEASDVDAAVVAVVVVAVVDSVVSTVDCTVVAAPPENPRRDVLQPPMGAVIAPKLLPAQDVDAK